MIPIRSTRKQTGFTLIEMLLVVSLISLLISIILPVMKYEKIEPCQANLKSINDATVMYAVDHQREFPGALEWVGNNWTNKYQLRAGTLYDYMGQSDGAYVCPEFVDARKHWAPAFQGETAYWTYSLNEYFNRGWNGVKPVKTMSGVQFPSDLHMYSDENPWISPNYANHAINNGAMGVGKLGDVGHKVDSLGSYHKPPYMNGGRNLNEGHANVLFVDGHIELVHVSESKLVVTPHRYRENWGWTPGSTNY